MCGRGVRVCDNGACEIVLCDKVVCVCVQELCATRRRRRRAGGRAQRKNKNPTQ